MEVLKNYLETMFAKMPETEDVARAKQELWSMMEDKYNELIAEGKHENEAIGTVISEFGNLEEISESLGLKKDEAKEEPKEFSLENRTNSEQINYSGKRLVALDEALAYISDVTASRFLLGLGVMFCIFAPAGPILGSGLGNVFFLRLISGLLNGLGVTLLFVLSGIGVGLIVLSSARKKEWKYLRKKECCIDYETRDYVKNEKDINGVRKSLMLSLGIVLCCISVAPVVFFGTIFDGNFFSEALGPSMIFLLTGIGVFFILFSSAKEDAYKKLLSLG
ncbi:MAG: hypothetical protein IJJ64_01415 [Butyrivibrio sp.]|jgi:hypothetical protein|nr:hypothetical protein [Butyrivibrio sp.]MBQ6406674.1 hypothetical protein [Butyrivibrio sp.]